MLIQKLIVRYVSERQIARPDGLSDEDGPQERIWAILEEEVSEAVPPNGSIRTEIFTYDLRGGSVRRNANGAPAIAGEPIPSGIAAALHAPFKVLYNSLQWSTEGADVDWTTAPGLLVDVRRKDAPGGSPGGVALMSLGVTARSAIQQITRDLATGTTSYSAGPPAHLGLDDLIALQRAGSRTRNAARGGGGGGGGGGGAYSSGFGPWGKDTGEKTASEGGASAKPRPAQPFLSVWNG